jgi:hypothetical protein
MVDKAENEKSVLCKHLDGRPCSLECCDYTQQHIKRWRTVSCRSVRKEKRRLSHTINEENEIATLTTVAASVRGSRRKYIDHYRPNKSHGQW